MSIYRRLFAYVPEVRWQGFVSLGLALASVLSTSFGFYAVYRILQGLLLAHPTSDPRSWAIIAALALTFGSLSYLIAAAFSHKLGFRLETQLRKRGIDGLSAAGFRYFDLNASGTIRKTIDDNAAMTHQAVAHMIPETTIAFLTPIAALILGFIVAWQAGLLLLLMTLLCALLMKAMMGGTAFMEAYQDALKSMSAETVEYVRGIPVIKIFRSDLGAFKRLQAAIQYYADHAYAYSKHCKWPFVTYQWIFSGFIAILIFVLALLPRPVAEAGPLLVSLLMLLFLSGQIMVFFMKIMYASQSIFNANYALSQLETAYQAMQAEHPERGDLEHFPSYDIYFNRVTFGYGATPVFEDFCLDLPAGKTYALVGGSGSGKSTLAKLLSGFYAVDAGQIKIGGRPLEAYSENALAGAIAFVFQHPKLFKTTLFENVALANPDASHDEVMQALSLAGCDTILDRFPEREHTLIGAKGVHLSGGEQQRIAIARALLKDAPIVVMDEASAAIDADNEYALQQAFKALMKGKTVIMIAHRLTSIRNVDEIIVLEGGQMIERGNHQALMEANGTYARLIRQYHANNEWRVSDAHAL